MRWKTFQVFTAQRRRRKSRNQNKETDDLLIIHLLLLLRNGNKAIKATRQQIIERNHPKNERHTAHIRAASNCKQAHLTYYEVRTLTHTQQRKQKTITIAQFIVFINSIERKVEEDEEDEEENFVSICFISSLNHNTHSHTFTHSSLSFM